jgi:sulfate adenylyltransferase subunit 2
MGRGATGGAAKERIFSFRDGFGQWDLANQRPEL